MPQYCTLNNSFNKILLAGTIRNSEYEKSTYTFRQIWFIKWLDSGIVKSTKLFPFL